MADVIAINNIFFNIYAEKPAYQGEPYILNPLTVTSESWR